MMAEAALIYYTTAAIISNVIAPNTTFRSDFTGSGPALDKDMGDESLEESDRRSFVVKVEKEKRWSREQRHLAVAEGKNSFVDSAEERPFSPKMFILRNRRSDVAGRASGFQGRAGNRPVTRQHESSAPGFREFKDISGILAQLETGSSASFRNGWRKRAL
ncbi:hypothetical protein L596_027543 [Steinernema carpocapsae]|uniref:Uncharacterized protein n=1 Tax=Steinernema carpocapsae TaxID=34508 RepID=A0A4U5LVR4_STECR|nr:hypothetical protein L596_027543 [Steinernema carpocapsae]